MSKSGLIILFLTTIVFFSPAVRSQQSKATGAQDRLFYGKFDTELSPDFVHVYQRVFKAVTDLSAMRFVPPLEKGALVWAGDLIDQRIASGKFSAMIVEPPNKPPFMCADINGDSKIEAAERFSFPRSDSAIGDLDLLVRHPIKNPLFKGFPIFTRFRRGFEHPQLAAGDRLVLQTIWALAYGTVNINGRNVRFQYPFDPQAVTISTTEGLFGVDTDGDGEIRNEQFSPETSYAFKNEIVFRLGDIYLSTMKVDLVKNEIVVRTRSKAEYLRHDIETGKPMPDFEFIDFEGKKRRLYEFKGKYLLVDFWGVWCTDCIRETPFHVNAMNRFRSRGFDILSLNTDEDTELAKRYVRENDISWTQARNDSIRKLVEDTYRIQEFPATILLGPDAKVLVLDQDQLRGDNLLKTLERMLPQR